MYTRTHTLLAALAMLLVGGAVAVGQNLDRLYENWDKSQSTIDEAEGLVNRPFFGGGMTTHADVKNPFTLLSHTNGDSVAHTGYDFQTNGTVPERIINWPEGSGPEGLMSTFIYMASPDLHPNTPDRGTYGAVLTEIEGEPGEWLPINLSNWERIEDARSGFCDVDWFKSGDLEGHIVAASHDNSEQGINVMIETERGSGNFFKVQVPGSAEGMWPRIAVGGDSYIHLIFTFWNVDPVTQLPNPNAGVLRYIRSTDQGATWDDPIDFAGPGEQQLRETAGADEYQIDANGEFVSLWYQTRGVQILQLWADDNGEIPWSVGVVAAPQYQKYYPDHPGDSAMYEVDGLFGADTTGYVSDTVATPGAAFDMMVLDDGTVIGAYPEYPTVLTRYLAAGESSDAWMGRGGIITQSWTDFEYDHALRFVHMNDTMSMSSSTIPLPDGVDESADFYQVRAYTAGLARWAQLGRSDAGHTFVVFGSGKAGDVVEEQIDLGDGLETVRFYRSHTYAVRTTNNGTTWSPLQDLTPDGVDAQFASLADHVDDEAHVIVQSDTYPGDYVSSESLGEQLGLHPPIFSNIEVMRIPEGQFAPTGVETAERMEQRLTIRSLSPNPVRSGAMIDYGVGETGDAVLAIYNSLGQKVRTLLNGHRVVGDYSMKFDVSSLPTGVYTVVLSSDGVSTSRSMTVVR